MEFGHILETAVAKRYAKKLGLWLVPGKFTVKDWRRGTPDFTFYDQPIGLEIKTTGDEKIERGMKNGEFPLYWEYQCRWYQMLLDYDVWHLAALYGGQKEYSTVYYRDLEIERKMVEQCETFWFHNVLKMIPPGGMSLG